MTSPYITEAMRRRELLIDVSFTPAGGFGMKEDVWLIKTSDNPLRDWHVSYTAADATRAYLAAINELSKEG